MNTETGTDTCGSQARHRRRRARGCHAPPTPDTEVAVRTVSEVTRTSSARSDQDLPADIRRRLGAFYTPEDVVEEMVAMIRPRNRKGMILEPSGGDGAFVQGLMRAGVSPGSIEVWDINPDVEEPLKELGAAVVIGDTLAYAGDKKRFRAVIGNPPYLNKQSEYIKANRSWLRKRYRDIGANDTYAMFTHLAVEMLEERGQVVFLVSDTFLTLGIHERFRRWLLTNTRVDGITLLPPETFSASVNTAIISATKTSPSTKHRMRLVDRRRGTADAHVVEIAQADVLARPGAVLSFAEGVDRLLDIVARCPRLVDSLHGGLGMHTGDNAIYLAVVEGSGVTAKTGQTTLPRTAIDGVAWRPYHKRGGDRRWYGSAEHAVRWDETSRGVYGIPASATEGRDEEGNDRDGFVLSGIGSRLAARRMTTGALWESNKVFGFFPRDPRRHPVDFFVSVLNSRLYSAIADALNHTVSLQVRDVKRLPMLPFTKTEVRELATLGRKARQWATKGGVGDPPQQERIDTIVEDAAQRIPPGSGPG